MHPSTMKQMIILMTGFGLLLFAEYSSAKYLLVDVGDDVKDGFRPINGDGLDLSDNAKDPKGISYPQRIIKMTLLIIFKILIEFLL